MQPCCTFVTTKTVTWASGTGGTESHLRKADARQPHLFDEFSLNLLGADRMERARLCRIMKDVCALMAGQWPAIHSEIVDCLHSTGERWRRAFEREPFPNPWAGGGSAANVASTTRIRLGCTVPMKEGTVPTCQFVLRAVCYFYLSLLPCCVFSFCLSLFVCLTPSLRTHWAMVVVDVVVGLLI